MDVSGVEFKHGDLVNQGHKGVWVTPLYPGKHPINTRVMKVELVPTTNIVLNWAPAPRRTITTRSSRPSPCARKDGFAFNLDVSQIIHVGALDAPKVISRVGSMQNLVDHVLQPIVGNYFRNSAQDYTVLDFLSARSQRQAEAAEHIRAALAAYDVQAIDTLIGDINPPARLMQTQTDRKIAEEQRRPTRCRRRRQAPAARAADLAGGHPAPGRWRRAEGEASAELQARGRRAGHRRGRGGALARARRGRGHAAPGRGRGGLHACHR